VLLPTALWVYDLHKRNQLLELTSNEVPLGTGLYSVEAFLERQGAVVYLDEGRRRVVGVMPQASIDRWLLDRQERLVFEMDDHDRLVQVQVRVDYTFL
jgi:hypothetical protein